MKADKTNTIETKFKLGDLVINTTTVNGPRVYMGIVTEIKVTAEGVWYVYEAMGCADCYREESLELLTMLNSVPLAEVKAVKTAPHFTMDDIPF